MSYADRLSQFNNMISETGDHIKAVAEAATNFDPKDPIGTGIQVATAAAGGISGVASSVAGIQHYGDFKQMYNRIHSRLGKSTSDNPTTGGSTSEPTNGNANDASGSSRGANAGDNDSTAPRGTDGTSETNPTSGSGTAGQDLDGGINDRIINQATHADPTAEANSINQAIEAKAAAAGIDKNALNQSLRSSGRSADEISGINNSLSGDLKTAAQGEYLQFKNNVANDAINRAANNQPPASGYDRGGNANPDPPSTDSVGPQGTNGTNVVRTQADPATNGAQPVGDNTLNLAPDANQATLSDIVGASEDGLIPRAIAGDLVPAAMGDQGPLGIGNLINRGRQALANLNPSNVPGRAGGLVRGLATQNADDASSANMVSRVQQQAADAHQAMNSGTANPNTTGGGTASDAAGGTENFAGGAGSGGVNPASATLRPNGAGSAAADGDNASSIIGAGGEEAASAASAGSKVLSGISTASDVADGMESLAGFAGPAAPLVALVGGLVSLGTTIAGLFHHKPKPEAPPPPAVSSVGANLTSTVTSGSGVY